MQSEIKIPFFNLVTCLSRTLDLVSPAVMNHHRRVAYIASHIATELKLPVRNIKQIILASLLHDIGVFSLHDKIDALHFEIGTTNQELLKHCILGEMLLKNYIPFSEAAPLVRAHHLYWQDRDSYKLNDTVLMSSQVIHLSDRVDVLIDRNTEILSQVTGILSKIEQQSGIMFCPELVKILKKIAVKECFWLDIISLQDNIIGEEFKSEMITIDSNRLLDIAKLFCQIIDFRSPFTATHSAAVAASAAGLAELIGLSPQEGQFMMIAGYLHDLGKLAIATEILEKPDKLTEVEYNIIRSHSFYGYRTLQNVNGLALINSWGSLHHERLDGQGYPFHLQGGDLTTGSRIMAVADIFTALMEKRPYRDGMSEDQALQILFERAKQKAIDINIVNILNENLNKVNELRITAQQKANLEYLAFHNTCKAAENGLI